MRYRLVNRQVKPEWIENKVDNNEFAEAIQDGGVIGDIQAGMNGSVSFTSTTFSSVSLNLLREGIERFNVTDINNPAGSGNLGPDPN